MTDPEERGAVNVVDEAAPMRAPDGEPPPRATGLTPWVAGVALLALAAAGTFAWLDARRGLGTLRSDVSQLRVQDDSILAQVRTRDSEITNDVQDLRTKQAAIETRLAETASQQAALDALYRDLAPSRDAIALSEVEQILVLASQQLSLAGNVPSALAAVQLADGKLARLDRPQFAPLRRSLAREIEQLKAVPAVDVPGIAAKLDAALSSIGKLPLARDERLPPAPKDAASATDSRFTAFLRGAWSELKSVVRIEVSDRPAAPLVSPEQTYFLRENLRLRLLSARLALLARDAQAFKLDINATSTWIKQYFDLQTKPVQDLVATLAQLSATPMPAALPDLSQSLEIVQTLKAAGAGATAPPARPK